MMGAICGRGDLDSDSAPGRPGEFKLGPTGMRLRRICKLVL